MDYRDLYVRMTGDEYNAYRPREDDVEGHMFSDKTMQRAVEALSDMEDDEQLRYAISAMVQYGPRKGATMGKQYPLSVEAGENYARGLIDEYSESDTLGQQISSGARGLLAPFQRGMTPQNRLGVTQGLLRYMMERARGE